MEKLDTQVNDVDNNTPGGFVHAHLSRDKKTLLIDAVFGFSVVLNDENGKPYKLEQSHINLRNGVKVPLITMIFKFTAKPTGCTSFSFEYDAEADELGPWEFIKVKFLPSVTSGVDQKKIVIHVDGSTVHYGDTD